MKVISELHEWPNLMRQHPDPENILKKPDGFTSDKARIDEQALQAEQEIATLAQDAAAAYNKTIAVVVSPRLTPFSEATSEIAAITLMRNHSHVSIICLCEYPTKTRTRTRTKQENSRPARHTWHSSTTAASTSWRWATPTRADSRQTPLPTTWKTC